MSKIGSYLLLKRKETVMNTNIGDPECECSRTFNTAEKKVDCSKISEMMPKECALKSSTLRYYGNSLESEGDISSRLTAASPFTTFGGRDPNCFGYATRYLDEYGPMAKECAVSTVDSSVPR
ncbi:uncharacterized protein LOC105831200 [Monomorium pharaonis]|uniref:uncharacterized protein LOC105831200 n=1 Tax=Monomorium pharaonis TaxID=307658 RepID=UPI00063F9D92|nr:uncharacterized protein LOC105831200 [Monomorium pharaonis]